MTNIEMIKCLNQLIISVDPLTKRERESLEFAIKLLNEQQDTRDCVPVVRCKACKHWNKGRCENELVLRQIDDGGCATTYYTYSTWFCPDGEEYRHPEVNHNDET